VISFKQLSEQASPIMSKISRKTWIWIGLGLAAVPALRIFYVQEMLAALIAFTVLFGALFTSVLMVFLLASASKPVVVWAVPKVGRVRRWSAEAVEDLVTNHVRAKAAPLWAKTLRVWAKALPDMAKCVPDRFGRVVRTSVGAVEDVIANSLWAKAVPVWAKSLRHFRKQQLKLNENYKMVRLRLARLRPRQVYSVSLQKGGAVLAIGLRTQKTISSQVGNWLRQPVRYPDFIRHRSISRVRSLRSRAQARPRP
jgi:hypothetical protein